MTASHIYHVSQCNTRACWDAHGGGYLPWWRDVWGSAMDLVSSDDGTPAAYGAQFRTRFGT